MAVRIPQHTPQVGTPGGGIAGAQGRGVAPFNIDTGGFARMEQGIRHERALQAEDGARTWVATKAPEAQLWAAQTFDTRSQQWTPESGDFALQIAKDFDTYTDQLQQTAPDEHARKLASEQMLQFKAAYMLKANAFATEQTGRLQLEQIDRGYEATGASGGLDPASFARNLAIQNANVISSKTIPESAKPELVRRKSTQAALTAARMQAENDPYRTYDVLASLLGIAGKVEGSIPTGPSITTPRGQVNEEFTTAIEKAAKKHGVPASLLYGIAEQESGFNPKAVGPQTKWGTAKGAFQFLDMTAEAHGINPYDIEQAADATAADLAEQIAAGGAEWAVAHHFAGPDKALHGPKTRQYVAEVMDRSRRFGGTAGAAYTAKPVDTTGDDTTMFRLLEPDQLIQIKSQAESNIATLERERRQQIEVNADLFKQRLDDIEVAATHGDPVQVPPDEELVAYLGHAQAILTKRKLLGYQQMAGGLKQLPGMPNAQLEAVAAMPDPDGDEDRENRQFVRDTMAKQAEQILAERKADPGKAALANSPAVQTAYSGYAAASEAFAAAGAQATQEQLGQLNTARSNYFRSNFAVQRQWGIHQPKLPKAVVDEIATGFRGQLAGGNIPAAAARMQNLPKELGSYEAIRQVGEETGDIGWFAMEGVPAPTLAALNSVNALKSDDITKLLPEGTKQADITKAVNDVFAPLTATLASPSLDGTGDVETAQRYLKAGQALAANRIISGQSPNVRAAAEYAYDALYGNRGVVVDSYRVPREFDAEKVKVGLQRTLFSMKPETVYMRQAAPGLNEQETRANILRNVQRNGKWVSNQDSSGVFLMVAGVPVMDAAGAPIQIRFSQAQALAPPVARDGRSDSHYDAATRATLRGTR